METNHFSTGLSVKSAQILSVTYWRAAAAQVTLVVAGSAAIALIGQISLPLPFTPVPVTLGTLAALGVGGVLGARRAVAAVALLAVAALLGAPVLANWGSGMPVSFGYVLGYALAGVVAAQATRQPLLVKASFPRLLLNFGRRLGWMLLASAVIYVPGLLWLKFATGISWVSVFSIGLLPFLIGDLLKSVVAALLPARRA